MHDYGKGTVLASLTGLPAASVGLLMANMANTWILASLLSLGLISALSLAGYISRYYLNRKL